MSDGTRPGPDDNHPFWRTDEQVMDSARRIAAAVEAGLSADDLHVMLAARRAWWAEGRGEEPDWPAPHELGRAIADERTKIMDEALCAAIRRHLRSIRP